MKANKLNKVKGKSVLIGFLVLVLIMFGVKIYRLFFPRQEKPSVGSMPETIKTMSDKVPNGWNPEPITDEFFQAVDGWILFDESKQKIVAEKFLRLNMRQQWAVHEFWIEKYGKKEGTLLQRMSEEWTIFNESWDKVKAILQNFT